MSCAMLIREICLRNLLSFGPETEPLEMRPLNVLIGPNGSGKSNLIEGISLLRSAPTHLAAPVRDGGGIRDWLWRGEKSPTATLAAVVENPRGKQPLRHTIEFTETAQKFELVDERIESSEPDSGHEERLFFYRYQNGRPVLSVGGDRRELKREDVNPEESILSQRKDPDQYPEITYLGRQYARVRLYREWAFGRYAVPRRPQEADQPNDQLSEDFRNLGLVLNRLGRDPKVQRLVVENLQRLYPDIENYHVNIEGGTVQVFFHESGFAIPATRLSDGTLRYLSLLVVLCHPDPPPLICIEEPELGLHPDVLTTVARLLKEASARTQLIVTTHSDILVDELTDEPESVIVCEKLDGATKMERLSTERLRHWLDKYRLGELWTKGELGGTRW